MNQSRIVFLIVGWACAAGAADVASGQFVQHSGQYIELTTDVATTAEAESLVASFDAAVPQWIEFWDLPADSVADWKVKAYVIGEKQRFRDKGWLPASIPDFPFGYAQGNSIWVLAQKSEYYTRHLVLHEGVHSLAFHQFRGAGPTWFMEGTAELLATHTGKGPTIKINQIPPDRESVPYWGRFKRIQQLRDELNVPTIETVMRYTPSLTGNVETYSWSWAATMLLDTYPNYHESIVSAARNGRDTGPGFNRALYRSISSKKWPVLAARWQLMCHDMDYGFDRSRERVDLSVSDPVWKGDPLSVRVEADRGWQSTGVRLTPGTKLTLSADGEIELDTDPKPWVSRPPGVTIQYYRGRPLGQLIACLLPNAASRGPAVRPLRLIPIESEVTFTVEQHSWLLFRVNDRVNDLANNRGHYRVQLKRGD